MARPALKRWPVDGRFERHKLLACNMKQCRLLAEHLDHRTTQISLRFQRPDIEQIEHHPQCANENRYLAAGLDEASLRNEQAAPA